MSQVKTETHERREFFDELEGIYTKHTAHFVLLKTGNYLYGFDGKAVAYASFHSTGGSIHPHTGDLADFLKRNMTDTEREAFILRFLASEPELQKKISSALHATIVNGTSITAKLR